MIHSVPADSPAAWPPAAGGLRMQRSDRSPTALPMGLRCARPGIRPRRDVLLAAITGAGGAVVVSVVVVHDRGDETDADSETAEQHRGGDHRPPWVARSGGEQRQR